MSGLMLLNPRGRKSAGRKRRRPMTAKQLKYFGPRRSRKAGGARRRRKGAAPKVVVIASNPRRKRRSAVAKKPRRQRRRARAYNKNPRPIRRRYRRNPISAGGAGGFLTGTLVPAGIGAGGALLVDLAIGNLPLPASVKQGTMLPLVRIAGALGVGALVALLMGEDAGTEAAAGGIVVTLYGLAKNYIQQNVPSVRLARYVRMNGMVRRRRINRFVPMNGIRPNMQRHPRMGKLKQFRRRRMGAYMNPARVSGPMGGGMGPRRMTPAMMRYIANK